LLLFKKKKKNGFKEQGTFFIYRQRFLFVAYLKPLPFHFNINQWFEPIGNGYSALYIKNRRQKLVLQPLPFYMIRQRFIELVANT
jgi:hypothetical protein